MQRPLLNLYLIICVSTRRMDLKNLWVVKKYYWDIIIVHFTGIRKHLLTTLYTRCTPRIVISYHPAFNFYLMWVWGGQQYWVHNNCKKKRGNYWLQIRLRQPSQKATSFLPEMLLIKSVGVANWQLLLIPRQSVALYIGTPRSGCVLTNANRKNIVSREKREQAINLCQFWLTMDSNITGKQFYFYWKAGEEMVRRRFTCYMFILLNYFSREINRENCELPVVENEWLKIREKINGMGQGMQVSCTLHLKSNDNNNKTLLINI